MSYQILGPDDPALAVLDQQLKSNPQWDTQLTIIPWDQYHPKMMAALQAEKNPFQAVCIPGHIWLPGLVDAGLLTNFENIIPSIAKDLVDGYHADDIIPAIARESRYDQLQYMLPLFSDGHIVFYRKDLIHLPEENGVPVIDALLLHQLVENITLEAGMFPMALKAHASEIFTDWLPYLWEAGGMILDESGTPVFHNAAAIRALEYYISLKKYCPPDTNQYGNNEIVQVLKDGKVALAVSWGGQAAAILNDDNLFKDRIGTAVFARPWNATWGVCLPANQSPNDNSGILSVLFAAASPQQDREVTRIAGSPVRQSSYQAGELAKYSWLAAQKVMLDRCEILPTDPQFSKFLGPLYAAVYDAFINNLSPADALKSAAQEN